MESGITWVILYRACVIYRACIICQAAGSSRRNTEVEVDVCWLRQPKRKLQSLSRTTLSLAEDVTFLMGATKMSRSQTIQSFTTPCSNIAPTFNCAGCYASNSLFKVDTGNAIGQLALIADSTICNLQAHFGSCIGTHACICPLFVNASINMFANEDSTL